MKKDNKDRKIRGGVLEWSLVITLMVLLILKIIGINIPWIWVLSPIWALIVALLIYISAGLIISSVRDWTERRKRRKWH